MLSQTNIPKTRSSTDFLSGTFQAADQDMIPVSATPVGLMDVSAGDHADVNCTKDQANGLEKLIFGILLSFLSRNSWVQIF